MIVRSTVRPGAEHFTLAGGIFRAHVADGVPLDRLAAHYGMSLPLLRDRLTAYVANCVAALEPPKAEAVAPPPPPPPPAPSAPPPVRIRVRERIEAPAMSDNTSRAVADAQAAVLRPIIAEIRATGAVSHSAIARALNERGIKAPRGGIWGPAQVSRLKDRIAWGEAPCP